jgi:hypothetical protein
MTVETIIAPEAPRLAPHAAEIEKEKERQRLRERVSWPSWLARVLLESFFIMLSILLALAVDNWSENRRHQRLAQQSLQIFERELRQNLALVEDVAPYHSGLRSVVAEAIANPAEAADMRSIVEGLKPILLRNTAWETALASGALTHIDVETISKLSLTYSQQEGFRQQTIASLPRFAIGSETTPEEQARHVRDVYTYLNDVVAREQDLQVYYKQALGVIRAGLRDTTLAPDSSS